MLEPHFHCLDNVGLSSQSTGTKLPTYSQKLWLLGNETSKKKSQTFFKKQCVNNADFSRRKNISELGRIWAKNKALLCDPLMIYKPENLFGKCPAGSVNEIFLCVENKTDCRKGQVNVTQFPSHKRNKTRQPDRQI